MRDAGEVIRADVRLDNYGNSRDLVLLFSTPKRKLPKQLRCFKVMKLKVEN